MDRRRQNAFADPFAVKKILSINSAELTTLSILKSFSDNALNKSTTCYRAQLSLSK